MKHICDEKGCRIVSDEEYEEYIKQQNKKTAEDKALIETFNSKVDFVDFCSLNTIMEGI